MVSLISKGALAKAKKNQLKARKIREQRDEEQPEETADEEEAEHIHGAERQTRRHTGSDGGAKGTTASEMADPISWVMRNTALPMPNRPASSRQSRPPFPRGYPSAGRSRWRRC